MNQSPQLAAFSAILQVSSGQNVHRCASRRWKPLSKGTWSTGSGRSRTWRCPKRARSEQLAKQFDDTPGLGPIGSLCIDVCTGTAKSPWIPWCEPKHEGKRMLNCNELMTLASIGVFGECCPLGHRRSRWKEGKRFIFWGMQMVITLP